MTDSLISPIQRFAMGVLAYDMGKKRDAHKMNPTAAGLPDWLAGWDAASKHNEHLEMAARRKVSPP